MTAHATYPVHDPAEDEKTIDARIDAIAAAQAQIVVPSVLRGRGQRPAATALIDSALASVTDPLTPVPRGTFQPGETGNIWGPYVPTYITY